MRNKRYVALAIVLGVALLLAACRQITWEDDDASAQSYGCNVYREQGCAKIVIASGGEIEARSGSTVDFQSGSDIDFDAVDFTTSLEVATVITLSASEVEIGTDGDGISVTMYSNTAGDYARWDSTNERWIVIGTAANPAIDIQDGYLNMEEDEYWDNSTNGTVALDIAAVKEYTYTGSLLDIGGNCLDLDAAGTTSFCADTDNQVDVEIGGADDFQFTANMFELVSGSAMKLNAGRLDLDANDDTSIIASTDNQIDIEIAGGNEYTATATIFDFGANKLELDLDDDTSITADTDDQVDLEIGGADEWVFTADQLDATNGQLVNIGAAGTDFSATGGLTLADALVVSSGGADVQGGGITMANDETIYNNTNAVITVGIEAISEYTLTATILDLGANKLELDLDDDTSITADTDDQVDLEISGADEWVFTADELDATNGQIVNIGAAGTDFDASGGLDLAGDLDVTGGDIILQNDERISNATNDTVELDVGGSKVLTVTATTFETGVDGTGMDVTFYGGTAGDYAWYDASEERFIVIGTAGAPGIDIQDGYLNMESDEYWDNSTNSQVALDIDGTKEVTFTATAVNLGANSLGIDLDGNSTLSGATDDEVLLTVGGTEILTATTSAVRLGEDGAGHDLYLYSDTAGDYALWDDGGARWVIIGTAASPAIDIQDGYLNMESDEYWDNSTDGTVALDIGASKEYTFTASTYDLGANKLELDLDDDTSITADTDDQIDVEVSGADDFQIIANTFILRAGSMISPENATDAGVVFATNVDFTYAVTSTAVTGGVIPANADIVDWYLVISTVFDGSGADTVTCGTAGDADKWIDDLDASAAGRNDAGDANDTQQDEWATSWGDVGGSNVTTQCIYVDANNDATAGVGTFVITYRIDDGT